MASHSFSDLACTAAQGGGVPSAFRTARGGGGGFDWSFITEIITSAGSAAGSILGGIGQLKAGQALGNQFSDQNSGSGTNFSTFLQSQKSGNNTGLWLLVGGGVLIFALVLVLVLRRK